MDKLKMHSPNLTQDNIARIRELFPGCVTEAANEDGNIRLYIDFDQLRQELSDSLIEGPQERYHLNWPGKRQALLTANAPIAKTLRPCLEESVNFDTTQNLFIEGDNLDALKLLQETYLGKVKMIYIDPPYNTGNDFIYKDNFVQNVEGFLRRSNQKDEEGNRLVANTDSNGRFHSDWLNMMYPRLKLARTLLQDDGVILISIDDGEQANLKKVCNEIFGADNFIGFFIWKSRVSEDTRAKTGLSTDHEYIDCYKNVDGSLRGAEKDLDKFDNPNNDPRGPWRNADITGLATKDKRPNLHYDLIDPSTGINYGCPPKGWRFDPNTMADKISEGRIIWPNSANGRPRQKLFLNEMESIFKNISSVIQTVSTSDGTRESNALLGEGAFDFPKPTRLIELFVEQVTTDQSTVVDFFAGSSVTANAVMNLNQRDGGNRHFIMVQLPEPCNEKSEAYKAGYKNIPEIAKERIRRAGKKILEGTCHENWNKDVGFRVLKVDTSNMEDVYYTPDTIKQSQLTLLTDNIKPHRTSEDLLFQVLLDWGVDLSLPIRKEKIQGKLVFFVDENALVACFDPKVNEELVKELAKYKPLRVVFRDNGFASDAVKINVEQIFKQLSPNSEVRSI
ncbi:MAG: site-specific DNA-methyltransferase [Deltaproteobacteria bacterium]|nr:site-specific DNA-methyltransferase [Deltaproteobacteria bacterium]